MTDNRQPRVCVGVIVQNPKGEMLLIRSHKFMHKWIVPGGGIEWGERGEDAAKRETLEETGLRISDVTFLQVEECIFPEEFHKEQHFIFFDYYAKTTDTKVALNDEAQEYAWVSPEASLSMDLNKSTRGFIKKYIESTKQ